MARANIEVDNIAENRAIELQSLGFQGFDAVHLACAEIAQVDVFLSTDDRLLRRAVRYSDYLTVTVGNPAIWFMTTVQAGDSDNDPGRT